MRNSAQTLPTVELGRPPILADSGGPNVNKVPAMYFYKTSKGVVSIIQRAGRWSVMFEDADLGSYISPDQAADDVAGGHTFMPPSGIDLGVLGIPRDISEWVRGRP